MAEILEYFDNIRIDVAKRKYYNVNKVNAVLEELRRLAVDLVEENELQRKELYQLRSELDKLKANGADIKFVLYRGCRHEILNDKCRDKVIAEILNFIK